MRALESFARASELAPSWPYPPYDMAFTYLLADRIDLAEQWYAEVDRLAPRDSAYPLAKNAGVGGIVSTPCKLRA